MRKMIFLGGLAIGVIVVFLAPFASSYPDGLEKVAEVKAFAGKARTSALIPSIFPDYAMPGICNERISVAVAGIGGAVIVFVVAAGLGCVIRRRRGTGR